MSKNKGFAFTLFAALGAIVGYASYMASQDEFSEETKNSFDNFLNKARNVSNDIQRTYVSIGDKDQWETSTKNLGKSTKKLATNTGELVKNASTDIYLHAKNSISNALSTAKDSLESTSNTKKNKSKSVTKASNKKAKKKAKK